MGRISILWSGLVWSGPFGSYPRQIKTRKYIKVVLYKIGRCHVESNQYSGPKFHNYVFTERMLKQVAQVETKEEEERNNTKEEKEEVAGEEMKHQGSK